MLGLEPSGATGQSLAPQHWILPDAKSAHPMVTAVAVVIDGTGEGGAIA